MSWGDVRGRATFTAGALASALALGSALFLAALCAEAAPFDPKGEDWEGLSQFARTAEVELGPARVTVTSTLDLHRLDPADAVVIVHPTRTLDVDGLAAFMLAGGRAGQCFRQRHV